MRIFFITSRFPFPLEKGDKLRAFELIRHLSSYHEIHLFAINEEEVKPEWEKELRPYCKEIQYITLSKSQRFFGLFRALFNGRPFSAEYFYSPAVHKRIDALIDRIEPNLVFAHLIRVAEYVRNRKEKKILDYMDVFSKGMARRARVEKGILKFASEKEYQRLLTYEKGVFDDFNAHSIISAQDRDLIPHRKNNLIEVVPNGVEMDEFKPQTFAKSYDLLFAGNMAYPPNVQAVKFLMEKVMPLVWDLRPETNLCIAGANPGPSVRKYAEERVKITGWVDDIRDYFWQSKLMLAPMRISIGLQNKILQGMSMEMPCIVSDLANNAVGASHDEHLIVAESTKDYCKQIIDLLDDDDRSMEIGKNARRFIEKNYNWNVIIADFNRKTIEPMLASDDR